MPRLKQVTFGAQPRKASLTVEADTAAIFRRIASYEGRPRKLSALLNDMMVLYLKTTHPAVDVELSEDDLPDDEPDPAERRSGLERRRKVVPGPSSSDKRKTKRRKVD